MIGTEAKLKVGKGILLKCQDSESLEKDYFKYFTEYGKKTN
jgi:hypothetical protein